MIEENTPRNNKDVKFSCTWGDFRLKMIDLRPREDYSLDSAIAFGYFTFLVYPDNEKSPVEPGWLTQMAIAYHNQFRKYSDSLYGGYLQNMPITMTIITPQGVKVSGWVNNFGAGAIFLNPDGIKFLAGREEGHVIHESGHRILNFVAPRLYNTVIQPNPYLDEALAILFTLWDTEIIVPSGEADCFKIPFDGLPIGNEVDYVRQLSVDNVTNLLDFKTLNGKGVFDSSLYSQRMILAMFFQTLISSDPNITFEAGGMIDRWLNILKLNRYLAFYPGSKIQEIKKAFLEKMKEAEQRGIKSVDGLFRHLFGTSKEEIEKLYLKFGTINYLVHRLSRTSNPRKFWADLDDQIRNKYPPLKQVADELFIGNPYQKESQDVITKNLKSLL